MTKDRIALNWHIHWPLPDIGFMLVKSAIRRRWTLIISLSIAEAFDYQSYFDYIWWLQLRAWWPPVYFTRGWLKRGF